MKIQAIKNSLIVLALCSSPQLFAQTSQACSSVATDPDGDGYGWENNASCLVTEYSTDRPEYTNLQTGNPVELIRAYWDGERDFVEDVVCNEHYFDGYSYATDRGGYMNHSPLSTEAPYVGVVSLLLDDDRSYTWSVDNGIYSGPFGIGASPWVEIVDFGSEPTSAIRTWISDNAFFECWSPNPNHSFVPTGSAPVATSIFDTGTCVDTDPAGDGWGWNGTSSCQISAVQSEADCVDSIPFGDGWGWNGTSSCRVSAVQSEAVCVDSIPFGDGWGWNGTSSCQIMANDNSAESACDYSDAGLYNGWGWNAVTQESCAPRS